MLAVDYKDIGAYIGSVLPYVNDIKSDIRKFFFLGIENLKIYNL